MPYEDKCNAFVLVLYISTESPVSYPSDEILANGSSYAYLPEEISRYMEGLFMEVRNG